MTPGLRRDDVLLTGAVAAWLIANAVIVAWAEGESSSLPGFAILLTALSAWLAADRLLRPGAVRWRFLPRAGSARAWAALRLVAIVLGFVVSLGVGAITLTAALVGWDDYPVSSQRVVWEYLRSLAPVGAVLVVLGVVARHAMFVDGVTQAVRRRGGRTPDSGDAGADRTATLPPAGTSGEGEQQDE